MDLRHGRALLRVEAQRTGAQIPALPVQGPVLPPVQLVLTAALGHRHDAAPPHPLERLAAGHGEVRHAPEGEDVGAGPRLAVWAADDLRRHPRHGAAQGPCGAGEHPREAEVSELRAGDPGVDEGVAALQIAVDDLRLLRVQVAERAGEVQEEQLADGGFGALGVGLYVPVEGRAWHQLQDQQDHAQLRVHAGPSKEDDAWMADVAKDSNLVGQGLKSACSAGGGRVPHALDSDRRAVEGAKRHRPKTALAQHPLGVHLQVSGAHNPTLGLPKRYHRLQAPPQCLQLVLGGTRKRPVGLHTVENVPRDGGLDL
mmetsp:Transcript_24421/g.77028  ORF Transcript_24421/g.77028 Transcript_24421/m.77028 type:complete len:313 (+) Transcript_24421:797-1735(+)